MQLSTENLFRSLWVCLFYVAVSGCTSSKLEPLDDNSVILAFGDSLTSGVGVVEEKSYPSILGRLTDLEVINAGVSGETTAKGLERLTDVLDRAQPNLVILMEGGNDILRNIPYEDIEKNLDRMIQLIQETGAQVILIGVPEKKLFSNAAPFYERLAEKHGIMYLDDLIGPLMRNPSMKSDSVHFNARGYNTIATVLQQALMDNGALHP